MTYIDEATYKQKIESPDNLMNRTEIIERRSGAGNHAGVRHPEAYRVLVGLAARMDGSYAASKALGVSQSLAQNLSKGENSEQQPIEDIKRKLEDGSAKAKDKAMNILLKSLALADDDEKLGELTIGKQMAVAKDASVIVEKLTEGNKYGPAAQVIIYTAPERDLADYGEPIVIGAKVVKSE